MSRIGLGYSYRELMAVALSRDIKDGESAHVGMMGGIPSAACLLAQKLHAPNMTALIAGFLNPKPRALFRYGFDPRNYEGTEAIWTGFDTWFYTQSGYIDFIFYSGIQIDKYGNCNLTILGDDVRQPKFRCTGIPNSGLGVTFNRFYLYHERQTKRSFVEKVDFITVAGNLDGVDGRRKAGIKTQGPKLCVTNLAVMDFDEQSGRMRLRSIHEGVSLEEVIQNTGFELIVPNSIPTTKPPTEEELSVLRDEIDTMGTLKE